MTGARLPAVRLPTIIAGQGVDEESSQEDGVVVDLPPSNKFGFAWPSEPPGPVPSSLPQSVLQDEPSAPVKRPLKIEDCDESEFVTPTNHLNSDQNPMEQAGQTLPVPPLSRAYSMALSSQLGSLQNPRRLASGDESPSAAIELSPEFSHFHELSLELADSVQTVIQTLLQLSPPQILDPAKEQFAACSLSIPTPSVSAMFTSMRNLNYMSANMPVLSLDPAIQKLPDGLGEPKSGRVVQADFDVGEMLQSMGDALSGAAAQAGIDLVLFHADLTMKHDPVKGDESGISYTLSHVIRQVINLQNEVILLTSDSPSKAYKESVNASDGVEENGSAIHPPLCYPSRGQPSFKSLILRRLLHHIGASLETDIQPKASFVGRICELTVTVSRGSPSVVDQDANLSPEDAVSLGYPADPRTACEPSLEQLSQFAESLRGKKVTLFANAKGSFAHHLTSYLTAWGLDVQMANVTMHRLLVIRNRKLHKLRTEQAYPLNIHPRKRPSLATNHRPRSSPQVARVMGLTAQPPLVTPQVVIVHFTSLSNYKLVRDAVQSILSPQSGAWSRIPEVIVVPKPAGPRRFLTALHTAITKPVVDPFFAPIATSPLSPAFHLTPFFNTATVQKSPGGRSTGSVRTVSDRSARSPKEGGGEGGGVAPSSPLGIPDGMEYFSDAASKLGTSPSAGLVIQSPDGQPAGIFFHPKPKTRNAPSSPHLERNSDEPKKGLTIVHADAQRRSPRPLTSIDVGSSEELVGTPPSSVKGKSRQQAGISDSVSASAEQDNVASSPTETSGSRNARKAVQGDIYPLVSPQSRTTAGPPTTSRRAPRRPNPESYATAPAAIPKKGREASENNIVPPISVLIVDDNPINQTILSTFMKKKKIKYDVAKNGEEAVQKWRSGGFHLILMDIQMPVMDGIQATKEIRRLEKYNGAPTPQSEEQQPPPTPPSYQSSVIIVALTASSLQSDRVAALGAGCNDFLTKPVSLHWLNNKIIEWGSIKALQMWADIRPEAVRSISTGQAVQAQNVARRLHVPEGRSIPTEPRTQSSSSSNRPVPLDAAMAAAASPSRAEKTSVPNTPPFDDSPYSSQSSNAPLTRSLLDLELGPVKIGTIPEVDSTEHVQDLSEVLDSGKQEVSDPPGSAVIDAAPPEDSPSESKYSTPTVSGSDLPPPPDPA
ncbi:hypothetical protein A0H81_03805 [Grifola frondosa]|uniref:Response regulatory domain-containing protein n=1 Tax=Grifola frondosa TaxID=5627 RepID=A0A1C7MKS6_GRIFR|nr:hypothetical protein A0H81_03805 [Grifola frondosa]